MNANPSRSEHGFPVRIILPGRYGEKNVKWIDRIEVSTTNEKASTKTKAGAQTPAST